LTVGVGRRPSINQSKGAATHAAASACPFLRPFSPAQNLSNPQKSPDCAIKCEKLAENDPILIAWRKKAVPLRCNPKKRKYERLPMGKALPT
jgi:hypothetical protein